MMIAIEYRKLKSTGFVPAFLTGGILAALIPVINTAARPDTFTALSGPALKILLNANSQMILLLQMILIVCGACIMYHTEYADRALSHMLALPLNPEQIYFGKAAILVMAFFTLLILEGLGLTFCAAHWFSIPEDFYLELLKYSGTMALLGAPTILFMLMVSSWCENMWISLGIGVLFLSTVTVLTGGPFPLKLVPFLTPFAGLEAAGSSLTHLLIGAAAETAALIILAFPAARIRRYTL